MTGLLMVPFAGIVAVVFGYTLIRAIIEGEICGLLAFSVVAAWFGFIIGSALMFVFTGYYPAAFCHVWNALFGWFVEPMPLPPRKRRGEPGR